MQTTLKVLSYVGKVSGFVAGAAAAANVIPPQYALYGVFLFGGASILKDTVNAVGDLIDDGKRNDSFKY